MSLAVAITSESVEAAVGAAEADFALTMVSTETYELVSNTACWIKQGGAMLVTCVAKASLAAGDSITMTLDGSAKVFAFDLTGTSTIPTGSARVNVSADTTAAQVAARLRTAVLAYFTSTSLTVTDNGDGTLTVIMNGAQLAITEAVANAGFLAAASTALAATAGSGSMFVAAGFVRYVLGKHGQTISVIRDAADGKASLTRLRFAR